MTPFSQSKEAPTKRSKNCEEVFCSNLIFCFSNNSRVEEMRRGGEVRVTRRPRQGISRTVISRPGISRPGISRPGISRLGKSRLGLSRPEILREKYYKRGV